MHSKPVINLVIGPPHSGKTDWCVKTLCAKQAGAAVMIVPDRRQATALRRRIPVSNPGSQEADPKIVSLESLAFAVLRQSDAYKSWSRAPITLERLILGRLLQLEMPATPAEVVTRSSAQLLLQIHSWMRADLAPDLLKTIWGQLPPEERNASARMRLDSCARTYTRYREYLEEQHLISPAAAPLMAASLLRSHPELAAFKTVVFDGFDTYDFSELAFMERMCLAEGASVTCTLCEPTAEEGALAFTRNSLDKLKGMFEIASVKLPSSESLEWRTTAADNGLRVCCSPTESQMAEDALCWIRERCEHLGFKRSDACIVVRSDAACTRAVLAAAERLQVSVAHSAALYPICIGMGARRLKYALTMFQNDWQTPDVLAYLNTFSTNSGANRYLVDTLRTSASLAGVFGGKQRWEELLTQLPQQFQPVIGKLRDAARTEAAIRHAWKSPPKVAEFMVSILSEASGSTPFEETAQESGQLERQSRRLAAVLIRQIALVRQRATKLDLFSGERTVDDLFAEAISVLDATQCAERSDEAAIQMISPESLHGTQFKLAAIVGFDDRNWPRVHFENAYLRYGEAALLGQKAIYLPDREMFAAREAFYACSALAAAPHIAAFYATHTAGRESGPSMFIKAGLPFAVGPQPGSAITASADQSCCQSELFPIARSEFTAEELEDQITCPFLRLIGHEAALHTANQEFLDREKLPLLRRKAISEQVTGSIPDVSRAVSCRAVGLIQLQSAIDQEWLGRFQWQQLGPFRNNGAARTFKITMKAEPCVEISGNPGAVLVSDAGNGMLLQLTLQRKSSFGRAARGESLALLLTMRGIEESTGTPAAAACEINLAQGAQLFIGRAKFQETVQLHQYVQHQDPASGVHHVTREQYSEMQKRADDAAVKAAESVVRGTISPSPGQHCFTCSYSAMCRDGALWLQGKR